MLKFVRMYFEAFENIVCELSLPPPPPLLLLNMLARSEE